MTPYRLTINSLPRSNVYRIYKRCIFFWWEVAAFESSHTPNKCIRRLEKKFGAFKSISKGR